MVSFNGGARFETLCFTCLFLFPFLFLLPGTPMVSLNGVLYRPRGSMGRVQAAAWRAKRAREVNRRAQAAGALDVLTA